MEATARKMENTESEIPTLKVVHDNQFVMGVDAATGHSAVFEVSKTFNSVKPREKRVEVRLDVINPIGMITESYDLKYTPNETGRFVLTIGGNQFMVTGNGKHVERVGENTEI